MIYKHPNLKPIDKFYKCDMKTYHAVFKAPDYHILPSELTKSSKSYNHYHYICGMFRAKTPVQLLIQTYSFASTLAASKSTVTVTAIHKSYGHHFGSCVTI